MSKAKTAVKVRTIPEAYAILRRAIRQRVKESGLPERQIARSYLGLGPGSTLNELCAPDDLQEGDPDEKALRLWFYELMGRAEHPMLVSHYASISALSDGRIKAAKERKDKAAAWRQPLIEFATKLWSGNSASSNYDIDQMVAACIHEFKHKLTLPRRRTIKDALTGIKKSAKRNP